MALYNRRIHGVVVDAVKAGAEAGIVALLGDPGYVGCFTVPLSATGDEPATHWAASAQVTQEQCDKLLGILTTTPGVWGYRGVAYGVDDESSVPIVRAGEPRPEGVPDAELRWDFDAVLEQLGLKRVVTAPAPGGV